MLRCLGVGFRKKRIGLSHLVTFAGLRCTRSNCGYYRALTITDDGDDDDDGKSRFSRQETNIPRYTS